jgi:Zn-dependent protease/predicted transcriptional regulator
MINRGIQLPFTLLGIPIRLDWSFLIILPLLAWIIGGEVGRFAQLFGLPAEQAEVLASGWTPYLLGLIAAAGLFLGVVLHELGHAITARAYGAKVRSITLWFLGGVAHFEDIPRQRGAEAVIAIVGPIVSLALAALCWVGLWLTPPNAPGTRFVLAYLGYMNVVLAIFNMIPALPLDGGRVLRSLLAMWLPFVRATQIASWISKGFALLIGIVGLLSLNFFLLLVALFIFLAVTTEAGAVQMEELLRDVPVRRVMNRNVSTVAPETRVGELADLVWRQRHTAYPVVDHDGRVLGVVSIARAHNVDLLTPIGQIMTRDVPTVRLDADAGDVLRAMLRGDGDIGAALVTDEHNRLVGIVTKTDIVRALQLRAAGWDAVRRPDEEPQIPIAHGAVWNTATR